MYCTHTLYLESIVEVGSFFLPAFSLMTLLGRQEFVANQK